MYISAVVHNEQGIGVYRGTPDSIPKGRVLIASWLGYNNGEGAQFAKFSDERGLDWKNFDVGALSVADIVNRESRSGIRCYVAFDNTLTWNPKAHPKSDKRPASELLYPIDQKIEIAGIEYDAMLQLGSRGKSGSEHYHPKGLERYFGLEGVAVQVVGNELVAIAQNRTQEFDIENGRPVFRDTRKIVSPGTTLDLSESCEPYSIVDDPVHNITIPDVMLDEKLPAFSLILLLIDDISIGHKIPDPEFALKKKAAEMILPNGEQLFDYTGIENTNPDA